MTRARGKGGEDDRDVAGGGGRGGALGLSSGGIEEVDSGTDVRHIDSRGRRKAGRA